MNTNNRFTEIAKTFYSMEKHISLKSHNNYFRSLSENFDNIDADLSLDNDAKVEKQLDLLTKLNIETSFIMLGRINKVKNIRYFCMIFTLPIAFILGLSIRRQNYSTLFISLIGIIIDIFEYIRITNNIDILKNDFIEHNKDFFNAK